MGAKPAFVVESARNMRIGDPNESLFVNEFIYCL